MTDLVNIHQQLTRIEEKLDRLLAEKTDEIPDGEYNVKIQYGDSEWTQILYRTNGLWRPTPTKGVWPDDCVTVLEKL